MTRQSSLAPESLTTRDQRAMSSLSWAAKAAGVLPTTSLPPSVISLLTSGDLSARTFPR